MRRKALHKKPTDRWSLAGAVTKQHRFVTAFSDEYVEERRPLRLLYNDYPLTRMFGLDEESDAFRRTLDDEYRQRTIELTERCQAGFRAIPLREVEVRH